MHKRVLIGIVSGALLGIVCIVGAILRSSGSLETYYLIAFWFNRVLIGLVVGLISKNTLKLRVLHGFIFGAIVSFSFYISTNFKDLIGFIAGVVYGIIIALIIYYFDNKDRSEIKK